MPWRVAAVQAMPRFRLCVRFVDGTQGVIDLSHLIHAPDAGVFAALADLVLFGQVFVEHGAVTWPGEIDLAPDAMYARIKRDALHAEIEAGLAGGPSKNAEVVFSRLEVKYKAHVKNKAR